MREVEVEVNVVGVREMLSYNNQSISRPSVEIDCGDRSTTDKVTPPKISRDPPRFHPPLTASDGFGRLRAAPTASDGFGRLRAASDCFGRLRAASGGF